MSYGHKSAGARVYEYGMRPPIEGEEEAIAEMRDRNRFWNKLVEIDHAFWEAVNAQKPEGTLKEALADQAFKSYFTDQETERRKQVRDAYRAAGLYWCNADDVVASYEAARRKSRSLRFHSWQHEIGKLTVRRSGGWPASAQSGQQFSIAAYENPHHAKHLLTFQIGPGRYLRAPIVLHRPLPKDAIIKSASVLREHIATKYRWKLIITVQVPPLGDVERTTRASAIAIDLGWRRVESGIRVAYWQDSTGRNGALVLPNSWLDSMDKVADLRGIRDGHFNLVKSTLILWLASKSLPQWLSEATATLLHWRSTGRLAALAWRWKDQRFDGDEQGYELAEAWRRRDKHLYEYEANLRDRLLRDRREMYRNFAAMAAREYGTLRLERLNLDDLARSDELPQRTQSHRFLAAPGELRRALENACQREGVAIEYIDSMNTTRECHRCGHVEVISIIELHHRCSNCGISWDQDLNAARNLLARVI